jgi:hypothetical protein
MDRKLAELNELLGAELGRSVLGTGLYAWHFSEGWFHTYLSEKPEDREAVLLPSGVYSWERKKKVRKMCPELHDQWVLAKWFAPGSAEEWSKHFGTRLPFPSRGYWIPTNVVLEPGVFPDMAVTQLVIGMIRRERENKYADYMNKTESAIDKADRDHLNRGIDAIQDAFTAFANPKPGARGGHVRMPIRDSEITIKEQ